MFCMIWDFFIFIFLNEFAGSVLVGSVCFPASTTWTGGMVTVSTLSFFIRVHRSQHKLFPFLFGAEPPTSTRPGRCSLCLVVSLDSRLWCSLYRSFLWARFAFDRHSMSSLSRLIRTLGDMQLVSRIVTNQQCHKKLFGLAFFRGIFKIRHLQGSFL